MTTEKRFPTIGGLRRASALALGLVLLAQVAPGAAQTTSEKLSEAEQQVKAIKRDLDRQRAKLDQVRAQIESLTRQILQALRQREALQDEIAATEKVINRKGKRVGRLQARLDARARNAYIQGPAGLVEAVLEADSLADLSDRVTFLTGLSGQDASVAAGLEVERDELGRFQADLDGYLAAQEELLALLGEQKEELDAKFASQVRIETKIRGKLAEAEEVVKDLKKQIRAQLLAQLRQGGNVDIVLKPGEGLLQACPVGAPRSYINDFGVPRPGGRTHQGNDIFAPHGTPIHAPFDGRAEEGSNGLGGLTVNVYAPSGTYVYNAHMSAYAGVDGQQVNAGDVIGYVGTSGNAAGTPPHDHFELHPGGGSAITPYDHLNLVCGVNGAGA